MFAAISLLGAGFLLGVLLAGIGASFIIGIIYRDAVSVVDSHMIAMAGEMSLRTLPGEAHSVCRAGSSHAND